MKMVKSLLLGTASGFVAVAGAAQAADMPVKARPVEYVKICSLYGDGYYYIPGSDTCIRIGGHTQFDVAWNAGQGNVPGYTATQGAQDRTVSQLSSRAYIQVAIDTRTQTQYGTLRTLNVFKILNQAESESTNAVRDFIQWAGFTIGRMDSFTNTWQYNDSYGLAQPQVGHDDGSNGVNAFAYTFEFGNGITLTFGADERSKKNITDLSVNSVLKVGTDPTDFTAGNTWYDPFVAGRIDQSWGYFSANVGLHDNNATYYTESGTSGSLATNGVAGYTCPAAGFGGGVGAANSVISSCGHPSDKIGWFAEAGGEIKLPFLGAGDKAGASVHYSQGAGKFGAGNNLASADLFSAGNQLALTYMTDAVYVNGAGLELTTAWSVQAGYVHNWSPVLNTSIYAGYAAISYDSTAQAYFSDAIGCTTTATAVQGASGAQRQQSVGLVAGTNCNPNWQYIEVGSKTQWSPVPNFYFAVAALYTYVWTAFNGDILNLSNAGANPVQGARPAGAYGIANEGIFSDRKSVV